MWSTAFFGEKFPAHIGGGVLVKRLGRIAALLRAVVHQPILTDVQIARSCAAAPLVRFAVSNGVLEMIEARVVLLPKRIHHPVHLARLGLQRLELTAAVVNDSDG